MPFGEAFVDEHTTRPKMPYKFNGKVGAQRKSRLNGKQDAETGLYYYGARYYEPKECRFYGVVDPMAKQHPNYNPFAYVYNNPIKFIDPFGLDTLATNSDGLPEVKLEEVVVKPTNEYGVNTIDLDKNGENYSFSKFGNPIYAKENTIENYSYYLENQDKFINENGDPTPLEDIFKSNRNIYNEMTEDIILEIADILMEGKIESGYITNALRGCRRSPHANKFPSNNLEFKATKGQQLMKERWKIEKKLSPYMRDPEFYKWEKTANDPNILW